MSGFFMVHRRSFEAAMRQLSGIGFKILLDLLASSKQTLRVKKLPYEFRIRHAGQSKLDSAAAWEYLMLLQTNGWPTLSRSALSLLLSSAAPVFSCIYLYCSSFLKASNLEFIPSQSLATLAAMTSNFTLNNIFTYRDMRLEGWR